MLIASLFFMIPMSPVYSTQTQRLSTQTKTTSQVITFTEPQTLYENMYSPIQTWGRAAVNNTFAFFNSQGTSKDDAGKKAAELPRTSPRFHFFFFIVAFCVLFIKNNNGLLSLAGRQAGTIRGRVIGCTGWGICWRRHGP